MSFAHDPPTHFINTPPQHTLPIHLNSSQFVPLTHSNNTNTLSPGFTRDPQGQWDKDFFFVHLADPLIHLPPHVHALPSSQPALNTIDNAAETRATGTALGTGADADTAAAAAAAAAAADTAASTLRTAISSVNKLRPRFLVMSGNFTYSYPPATTTIASTSTSAGAGSTATTTTSPTTITDGPSGGNANRHDRSSSNSSSSSSSSVAYESEVALFRKTMARVSETIPILFVPGDRGR